MAIVPSIMGVSQTGVIYSSSGVSIRWEIMYNSNIIIKQVVYGIMNFVSTDCINIKTSIEYSN